jgi:hypothetical protein
MSWKQTCCNGGWSGMAGELGYELQGSKEYAPDIHDAILEAGKPDGLPWKNNAGSRCDDGVN